MPNETKQYNPQNEEKESLEFIYDEIDDMIDARNRTYRQFNDRTLRDFIDDSEKRVQGYVPSREAQGKSSDQANVFSQDTRTKLKAIVAAVANKTPDINMRAVHKMEDRMDPERAEIMEKLVDFSRNNNRKNPKMNIFWETWECITKGTVVKYDGYLNTKAERKIVQSYDKESGEVEFEKKEVTVRDEMIDWLVPLREFYIKDFHINHVQDQPAVAWIRYMDKEKAREEFERYDNWKYIEDDANLGYQYEGENKTFMSDWQDRVDQENEELEVIRYYNKFKDTYAVVINGVRMFEHPMMWGKENKLYPFSKSIYNPFSSRSFFYGNSIANANMDVQDTINSLVNMMLDKSSKSLTQPLLASQQNKDLLEEENNKVGLSDMIYVDNVDQVKPMDVQSVENAEFQMLQYFQQRMSQQTVSQLQQGIEGQGVTAREIVIANQKAKKMKGMFFDFLTDLWMQKTRLRVKNILRNYTTKQVKEVVGSDGQKKYSESFRTIRVHDTDLSDGTNGTLEIDIRENQEDLPAQEELDLREEEAALQGESMEAVAITSDYLDDFDYDFSIVPQSIQEENIVKERAEIEEKTAKMAKLFPRKFKANKNKLFKEFIKSYGDSPKKYKNETKGAEALAKAVQQVQEGGGSAGGGSTGGELSGTPGPNRTESPNLGEGQS